MFQTEASALEFINRITTEAYHTVFGASMKELLQEKIIMTKKAESQLDTYFKILQKLTATSVVNRQAIQQALSVVGPNSEVYNLLMQKICPVEDDAFCATFNDLHIFLHDKSNISVKNIVPLLEKFQRSIEDKFKINVTIPQADLLEGQKSTLLIDVLQHFFFGITDSLQYKALTDKSQLVSLLDRFVLRIRYSLDGQFEQTIDTIVRQFGTPESLKQDMSLDYDNRMNTSLFRINFVIYTGAEIIPLVAAATTKDRGEQKDFYGKLLSESDVEQAIFLYTLLEDESKERLDLL